MSDKWLLFDINETVLDLGPVEQLVNKIIGDARGFDMFFNKLLCTSHVYSLTGAYGGGFTALQKASLFATCEAFGIKVSDSDFEKLKETMGTMPAHPEVPAALDELKRRGWKLCAFSNSTLPALTRGLQNAGIAEKFDKILSVEGDRSFKPLHSAYQYALYEMGIRSSNCIMVSCHDWDLAGGMSIGIRSAWIKRPGKTFVSAAYSGAFPEADFVCTNFDPLPDTLDSALNAKSHVVARAAKSARYSKPGEL